MLKTASLSALLVALLASVALAAGANAVWRDVLDAPATKSPLAPRTLLNGLARAGDRLVAVGQRGHALYSDDLGTSWKQADVPVVNAWISHPDTPAYLWKENESLLPSGLVDFEAHGVIHNIPIEPDSTDAFIHNELFGPLDVMQQHFGKRPIAYIWPRGLFTPKAVQVARTAGYQAGFTTLPRRRPLGRPGSPPPAPGATAGRLPRWPRRPPRRGRTPRRARPPRPASP